jgi:hypothetical protein
MNIKKMLKKSLLGDIFKGMELSPSQNNLPVPLSPDVYDFSKIQAKMVSF